MRVLGDSNPQLSPIYWQGGKRFESPLACLNSFKSSHTLRLMVYFLMCDISSTKCTWESVRNMRSTGCSSMDWGDSSPTPWSPPSHQRMAPKHFPIADLLASTDEAQLADNICDEFCLLDKKIKNNLHNMFVHAGNEQHHWLCSSGLMAPLLACIGASTPSFSPSNPPNIKEWGGKSALADRCTLPSQWAYLHYKKGWPKSYSWEIIDGPSLDAVIHAIQLWYCHHSIRRYIAWQIRRRLTATTIQCWKWRIWLDRWFAQQAKKHLCLCLLCHGALAYTMLIGGSRHSPPTPTDTPSTPKSL